jgi:hypothetical protein
MPEDIEAEQAGTARANTIKELLPRLRELIEVTDLKWDDATKDIRLLAINHVMRRQLEALDATLSLAAVNAGHLAVVFVRPALEEMLWIKYLTSIDRAIAQRLLSAMGSYDSLRSLLSQADYIGEKAMCDLWYSPEFLAAARDRVPEVERELSDLRSELTWQGRQVPSTAWIAKSVGERRVYEYLHSATSRSLHFSAGEVLRRSWGTPGGKVTTEKPEFRTHLSEFALDQLWRLLLETAGAAMPLLSEAGIESEDSLTDDRIMPLINGLLDLGKVPLVHAHEWNLTPEGSSDEG